MSDSVSNERAAAREKALSLLARREHSVLELQRKLTRTVEPEIVQLVTESLVAEGLLSDERYAEMYVRSRANRGYGPRRITLELKERGVSSHLIEQALDFEEEFWIENLREQHQKKYAGQQPGDLKTRQKQVRFFSQRGFSHEHIKQVLQ